VVLAFHSQNNDGDDVRTNRVWRRVLGVEHTVIATNTDLRLLTRRAYGYHSPEALIAMADLTRGGLCLPLPGRS
jgi:hypothetical protein